MNLPVLIVGAGPVGLTMAMALKRRGVDVRIVDKAAARTDKSKALVIWPRTLELLDIEGCTSPFVEAGLQVTGARILDGHGRLLIHAPLTSARSIYRYALMIPQSDTERLLDAQLATLGVAVERGVEMLSFDETQAGVSARLRHADGSEETVAASWIAACDGAHSTVRHAVGAQFEGDTSPVDFLLADIEVDGDLPRDELTICWAADGIVVFFPIDGTRMRVIADCGMAGDAVLPAPTLEEVGAIVAQRVPAGLRLRDPVWLSRFRINERKVKSYRWGRAFLAGDAAHVHSPAGGQGMNTGMQDAFNLAWRLALVWHGHAAPSLLDSYSPERSAIGDQVLRNAGNMTRVAMLRNPLLQEIRGLVAGNLSRLPVLRQHMIDQLTEVDLHYPDSPLTRRGHGAAKHPAPGERAVATGLVALPDGKARLHEVLGTGRFVVLSVAAPRVQLPQALDALAVAVESTSGIAGYDPGHVYLIRPDAYVATSTRGDDPAPIIATLQALAG